MISPSQDSAQLVGMCIAVLLLTGFTVLSGTALRRRSANKKCVLSLTFLLGGWAIATLGLALSRQNELGPVAQMIPSSMRLSLQNIEPAHRTRYLHQTMHRELSALELRDAQIENIEHPQEPLKMRLKYVVRQKFQTVGQQLIGQLPAVWERIFLASVPVEQRQTPFKVWVPTSFASSVTIAAPSGWKLTASESKSLEKPFCAASVESRLEQRKLKLESKLSQRAGQFPAGEYSAFNDAMSSALGLVERNVVFKKGE